MKYILPFLILLLSVGVSAQVDTLIYKAPCATGMVTTIDAGDLMPTDCPWVLNGDVSLYRGSFNRRRGLKYYGDNATALWGLTGAFTRFPFSKRLIGVKANAVTGVGQLCYSYPFDLSLGLTLSTTIYPYKDAEHRWEPWGDITIHVDGKSIPFFYSDRKTFTTTDSTNDSIGTSAHVYSLGFESPGQLRWTLVDVTDTLPSKCRYSYAFLAGNGCNPDAWKTNIHGDMAIPTSWVYPGSDRVILSLFADRAGNACDSSRALVLRQRDGDVWRVLDTIKWNTSQQATFVDSTNDGGAAVLFQLGNVTDTVPRPGQLKVTGDTTYFASLATNTYTSWRIDVLDDGTYGASHAYIDSFFFPADTYVVTWTKTAFAQPTLAQIAKNLADEINGDTALSARVTAYNTSGSYIVSCDSSDADFVGRPAVVTEDTLFQSVTYRAPVEYNRDSIWIAYSEYDPVTKFESPMGPSIHLVPTLLGADDDSLFSVEVIKDATKAARPPWIRLYVNPQPDEDTLTFYGIGQFRANSVENVASNRTFHLGNWTDSGIIAGLDSASILSTLYESYSWNYWYDALGAPLTQPYHYYQGTPFTDIAIVNGRGYGIGDPEFPNRIYYSQPDSLGRWIDYRDIDPNPSDKLVAIEPTYGGRALMTFKNNKVYVLDGELPYQPTYEFTDAVIKSDAGAVNRASVVRDGDDCYFLGTDLRVYKATGQNIIEISRPVEDWFTQSFANVAQASLNSRVWLLGDHVNFTNDTGSAVLSYNTRDGVWSRRDYGIVTPRGTIKYDTSSVVGFASFRDVVYFPAAYKLQIEDTTSGLDAGYKFPTGFELPEYGNGIDEYRIEQVWITMAVQDTSAGLELYVISGGNDTLDGDTIRLASQGSRIINHKFQENHRAGRLRLAVRYGLLWVTTGTQPYNYITIDEIRIAYTNLGSAGNDRYTPATEPGTSPGDDDTPKIE